MKKAIMALAAAGSLLASCTNESIAFDDFERQTIYMPYQYPVSYTHLTLPTTNEV